MHMVRAVQGSDEVNKKLRQWKFQLSEMGFKMVRHNLQEVVKKV